MNVYVGILAGKNSQEPKSDPAYARQPASFVNGSNVDPIQWPASPQNGPRGREQLGSGIWRLGTRGGDVRVVGISVALFGDSENGRESERARFMVDGQEFMSTEPISREDASKINASVGHLRKILEKAPSERPAWSYSYYVDHERKNVWAVMPIARRRFRREFPRAFHMTKNYYVPGTPEGYAAKKDYGFIIY